DHSHASASLAPGQGGASVSAMEDQGRGSPAQASMTGKVWQILIATLLAVILLVGLGVWQLHRLQWKEALIAERDSRLATAPVSLDQALKEFEGGHSVEFLKVEATGTFQNDAELFYLTTDGGVPGFEVVTPL